MLKTFIEHIQKTTNPQLVEVDGATFAVCADGTARELRPIIDHPDTLLINSLDALVKLVKTEAVKLEKPLYITIPDHITVRCFGQPEVTRKVSPADVLRGQSHGCPRLGRAGAASI